MTDSSSEISKAASDRIDDYDHLLRQGCKLGDVLKAEFLSWRDERLHRGQHYAAALLNILINSVDEIPEMLLTEFYDGVDKTFYLEQHLLEQIGYGLSFVSATDYVSHVLAHSPPSNDHAIYFLPHRH